MSRRSAGGRPAARLRRAAARTPPPQTAPPPAQPQNGGGSVLGRIGSSIAEGMALGSGIVVARMAANAVMGPRTIQHETVASDAAAAPVPTASSFGGADPCGVHSKAFQDCINNFGSRCEFYMDMLAECRKNSGMSVSVVFSF